MASPCSGVVGCSAGRKAVAVKSVAVCFGIILLDDFPQWCKVLPSQLPIQMLRARAGWVSTLQDSYASTA